MVASPFRPNAIVLAQANGRNRLVSAAWVDDQPNPPHARLHPDAAETVRKLPPLTTIRQHVAALGGLIVRQSTREV